MKLLPTLFKPMDMLELKLKSSTVPVCGDSPLNCQRSMSRSLAILMEGFVTVKLVGAADVGFRLAGALSTAMGARVLGSGVEVTFGGSWVFSKVSTCSSEG